MNKGEKFRKRFMQGEHCLMASINGEVAGYLWFCANEQYMEESCRYRFSIPLNAVYSYDIYVNPIYRRKGIFKQLYKGLSEWMREYDKDSIMTIIDYSNELSLKIHSRIGFRPIKSVLGIRILGLRCFVQRRATAYSRTW
jgi:L-amino acid N-acyltransferase YncA